MKRPKRPPDAPPLFDLPLAPPEPGAPIEQEPPVEPEPAAEAGRHEGLPLFRDVPAAPEDSGATPVVPPPRRGARLRDRLRAGLLDLAVHLAALVLGLVGTRQLGVDMRLGEWPGPWPGLLLFLAAFSFLYHNVPLAFWGRTPGMASAGIFSRSRSGETLTFGQCLGRWLGAALTVALAGLPLLIASSGRSLSDRLSGSQTWRG